MAFFEQAKNRMRLRPIARKLIGQDVVVRTKGGSVTGTLNWEDRIRVIVVTKAKNKTTTSWIQPWETVDDIVPVERNNVRIAHF